MKTHITFSITPHFLGYNATNLDVDMHVLNIVKMIEKRFGIDCDYTVRYDGDYYTLTGGNNVDNLIISEYLDNEWFQFSVC